MILDREDFLRRFDENQRIKIRIPRMRREETGQVIRHVGDEDRDGVVLFSRLSEATIDEAIREQVAYFAKLGYAFEWKVYEHDRPADLKERLARQRFTIGEEEAFLTLDLAQAPAALLQPVTLDVRRETDPVAVAGVMAVKAAVWNAPSDQLGARLAADLRERPELISLYVGYDGEKPVCSAWTYFDGGSDFAGLWGGSTLAEYRGRGYYTALLSLRVQEALRRGIRYLIVDASPMSRPILEKHGFTFVEYTYPCEWSPAD
ncbi:MAG TPA: GNAT family N-acetyltransferase [Anaerolineaceae bacterium]|nr:GNAT family N-acetyltransferase [Anaerolineaceae bacterium]